MAVPAARFSSPPRWSRTVAHTAFACAASLLLHALALGGLAWLYRSSAAQAVASLDVQIASVYLAPAAPPMAAPVSPPSPVPTPSVADTLPAPPSDLAVEPPALDPPATQLAPAAADVSLPTAVVATRDEPVASASSPDVRPSARAAVSDAAPRGSAPGSAQARPGDSQAASAMAIEWRVQDWLAQHRQYPRAARRSGAEGTVWVRFVLDRGGTLQGSELLESSGHAVLDRAALDLLQRAAPFPALPANLAMDEIELVLPIEYDLTRAARG